MQEISEDLHLVDEQIILMRTHCSDVWLCASSDSEELTGFPTCIRSLFSPTYVLAVFMSTIGKGTEEIVANEFFEPDSSSDSSASSSSSSSDEDSSESDSESDSEEQQVVSIQEMDVKELRRQRKSIKGLNELSDDKVGLILVLLCG